MIIKKVKINDGNLRYKINKVKISRLVGNLKLIHLGMTGKIFLYDNKK